MRWECAECGNEFRSPEPLAVCPVCGQGEEDHPAGSRGGPGPLGLDGFRGAWLEQGLDWIGGRGRPGEGATAWLG